MQDVFISKIYIKEVRNIKGFEINLSEIERKHLIITGKNGSGKTSLLESVKGFFSQVISEKETHYYEQKGNLLVLRSNLRDLNHVSQMLNPKREEIQDKIRKLENWLDKYWELDIFFNPVSSFLFHRDLLENGKFIMKFFGAKRSSEFVETSGVKNVEFKPNYQIGEKTGHQFTQHLVNLHYDKLSAKDENDLETAYKIDKWFFDFEKTLASLFDEPNLQLVFDRKNRKYQIVENGNSPYTFNQLPDGYSAILDIVTELIMRMEEHKTNSYDVQGIVLIDEIETHLHVDLQKKILPFLTSFFPKIQFIVTTHSPFIINSIKNAVICDLEKRIVTEDLSGYSYDTIIESYFGSDKYSDELKRKIEKYEELLNKNNLTETEKDELLDFKIYFSQTPTVFADELAIKLNELNLKAITRNER